MRTMTILSALLAGVIAAGAAFAATARQKTPPTPQTPAGSAGATGFSLPRSGDPGTTTRSGAIEESTPADAASQMIEMAGENKYESVHFTIVGDMRNDAYFERLRTDCEKNFSNLQREFWDYIPPQHREAHITILSFGSQEAFDSFAKKDSGLPRGDKGYSTPRGDRITFERQDKYYRDVMIVVHEMTHLFNHFCLDNTPLWLDEGMAQYYSYYAGAEAGNASLRSGINHEAIRSIDDAMRKDAFVEVSTLLGMGEQEFYSDDNSARSMLNYSESWALVYYLRRGLQDGDDRFGAYYAALARNEGPYAAFTRAYGDDHEAFRRAWIGFLHGIYRRSSEREKIMPAAAKRVKANVNSTE